VEVSALQHAGVAGTYGRSPLLRLQSDERLIALIRRGNHHAFEALVARYNSRLLSFCRHMLGSKEDAEDVLQEVFAAAFNAIQADDRPLNVRPWLYRIARNRSLNHLRRTQAVGVDSMDIHFADGGATTADKVHKREDFRMLLVDVQGLPETQRTALLLREIDALSYDQIAGAMETTIPSVKSLLVRARVSLAEAAEARLLSCEDVRTELGEVAEGLKRLSPPARRHLKTCSRCSAFRIQLKETNKALAAVFPVGPLLLLKKLIVAHLGTSASAGGAGSAAGGAGAAAGTAAGTAAAGTAAAGSAASGLLSAGASAVATKAAAGIAAAAIVTAGAVEVKQAAVDHPSSRGLAATVAPRVARTPLHHQVKAHRVAVARERHETPKPKIVAQVATTPAPVTTTTTAAPPPAPPKPPEPQKTQTVSDTTRLPGDTSTTPTTIMPATPPGEAGQPGGTVPPAPPAGEGGPAPAPPSPPSPPPPPPGP
jgi:RNA polymerase sigma factor (sigma-70 family)